MKNEPRIAILDGWRAASILLVLFSHWFPTPRAWRFNEAVGAAGMAIFFALSGFLITRLLLKDFRVIPFLVRRLMRILPLAWAAMTILYVVDRPGVEVGLANFLFYSNLPPAKLMVGGEHLWSLCVEVQFYIAIALLVAMAGRTALYVMPLCCLGITALRVAAGQPISIVTWHRLDEILIGATLALFVHYTPRLPRFGTARAWYCVALAMLLLMSGHPAMGWLRYFRPYFAGAAIGTSLYAAPRLMTHVFTSRIASYVAKISYALYVVHGMLTATWLGGAGESKLMKYMLRPLLAALTFAVAHLSTFYYEQYWIRLGKRLTGRGSAEVIKSSA